MSKARKVVKTVIVMDSSLELALRWYVPEIANIEDINLLKQLAKLHKDLKTIDCVEFRELIKTKQISKLTTKMKEIKKLEEGLVYLINQRNLDF